MTEEYVNRKEFDSLKEEVKIIKKEFDEKMAESSKLLQTIDKKIDVINEKIINSDEIDELKLDAVEKRVDNVEKRMDTSEDSQKWLRRTIYASAITIVVGAIVFTIKQM